MSDITWGSVITLNEEESVATDLCNIGADNTFLGCSWIRNADDYAEGCGVEIDGTTLTVKQSLSPLWTGDSWYTSNTPPRIAKLADGRVILGYVDPSKYPRTRLIDISSVSMFDRGSIDYGEAGDWVATCQVETNKVFTCWRQDTTNIVRAVITTVSGNTQTKGTVVTITNDNCTKLTPILIDTDKVALVVVNNTEETSEVIICEISGTAITCGSQYTIGPINTMYIGAAKIDTNKLVVAYRGSVADSSHGYIIAVKIAGTGATIGTRAKFIDEVVANVVVCEAGTGACIVGFQDNSVYNGKTVFCKIYWNEKNITVGTPEVFEEGLVGGYTDKALNITTVSSGLLAIIFQDDSDSDYAKLRAGTFTPVDYDPIPFLQPGEEPHRIFTIGDSDYSDRVLQWPTIRRTANEIKSTNIRIPLANDDRALNTFYDNLYTVNNSCELIITTTDSGQAFTVFRGFLNDVSYSNEKCTVQLKDRLWKFNSKTVGNSTIPASFQSQIPSDIAWTLCTCYGGLDDTEDVANTDIDYDSFAVWAKTFSDDAVVCQASFPGVKISEALSRLAEMTNSQIWPSRLGKIKFKAKLEIGSSDTTFINDWIKDVSIDLGTTRIINKQYVYGAYDVESRDWFINVVNADNVSITSYGIYEDIMKNDSVWYTSSVDMLVLAGKRTGMFRQPPKTFNIQTPLMTINQDIGDRVGFVDSFFSIDSSASWRIVSNKLNMDTGLIEHELDGAVSIEPFTLDISELEGPGLLV